MSNPQDPYGQPATDRTIIIPTPGGSPSPAAAMPQAHQAAPDWPLEKVSAQSINPLIGAASTLIAVAIRLRTTMKHDNVPDLHKRLTEEIQAFDRNARNVANPPEAAITARYLLCTFVDEIVLNTPWGSASGWSQHSLLSLFHKETSGGEKCFDVLQGLLEMPGRHLDLLELYYLCLSLGFQGKYRLVQRGHEQLELIRDNLYRTIEQHRPPMERDLSPHWEGSVSKEKSMIHFIPMWVIFCVFLAILITSYSGFRVWLYNSTEPVASEIETHLISNTDDIGQELAPTFK